MGAAVLARTAPQAEQTERTKPDTVHEPRGGQIKQENFTAFLIALTAPLNRTRTLWHLRRSHACGLMGALLSDRPTVEASHQRIGAKHQEQFFEVLPPPEAHTVSYVHQASVAAVAVCVRAREQPAPHPSDKSPNFWNKQ